MSLDKYVEEFYHNSGGEGGQQGGDPDERVCRMLPPSSPTHTRAGMTAALLSPPRTLERQPPGGDVDEQAC